MSRSRASLWMHVGAIRPGNLPRLRHAAQRRLKCKPFFVDCADVCSPPPHVGAIRPSNLGWLRITVQMRLKMQAFLVDCAGVQFDIIFEYDRLPVGDDRCAAVLRALADHERDADLCLRIEDDEDGLLAILRGLMSPLTLVHGGAVMIAYTVQMRLELQAFLL